MHGNWKRTAALILAALPVAWWAGRPAVGQTGQGSAGGGAAPEAAATLSGSVVLFSKANPDLVLRKFTRLVVYLKPADGRAFPPPTGKAVVLQKGARFTPPFIVVARGTTVEFPNNDDIFHNVFSYSPAKKFDLGLYKEGVSKQMVFDQPGLVKIHCSIHETMNGTIFVADSPHFAVLADSGEFSLAGVPPGEYELRTWHARYPAGVLRLKLRAGQKAAVTLRLGESHSHGS